MQAPWARLAALAFGLAGCSDDSCPSYGARGEVRELAPPDLSDPGFGEQQGALLGSSVDDLWFVESVEVLRECPPGCDDPPEWRKRLFRHESSSEDVGWIEVEVPLGQFDPLFGVIVAAGPEALWAMSATENGDVEAHLVRTDGSVEDHGGDFDLGPLPPESSRGVHAVACPGSAFVGITEWIGDVGSTRIFRFEQEQFIEIASPAVGKSSWLAACGGPESLWVNHSADGLGLWDGAEWHGPFSAAGTRGFAVATNGTAYSLSADRGVPLRFDVTSEAWSEVPGFDPGDDHLQPTGVVTVGPRLIRISDVGSTYTSHDREGDATGFRTCTIVVEESVDGVLLRRTPGSLPTQVFQDGSGASLDPMEPTVRLQDAEDWLPE